MTLTDGIRLWFIVIWCLAIVGFLAAALRFRDRRDDVEEQAGLLPTPMTIFNFIVLLILLTRSGEIGAGSSAGWLIVRVVGVGLSLYGLIVLPWTVRTLGRLAAPGPAVLQDHELITSGPFKLVRHPGTRPSWQSSWGRRWACSTGFCSRCGLWLRPARS